MGADVLLARPEGGDIELLSGTAATTWRLLFVPRTVDELSRRLEQDYDATVETIRSDLERLLEDLGRAEWIEEVMDADP